MSMVVTRSPLTAIGMNGAGGIGKRRSARLSADGQDGNENEPPSKKARVNAAQNAEAGATDGAAKKKGRKQKGKDMSRGSVRGECEGVGGRASKQIVRLRDWRGRADT